MIIIYMLLLESSEKERKSLVVCCLRDCSKVVQIEIVRTRNDVPMKRKKIVFVLNSVLDSVAFEW